MYSILVTKTTLISQQSVAQTNSYGKKTTQSFQNLQKKREAYLHFLFVSLGTRLLSRIQNVLCRDKEMAKQSRNKQTNRIGPVFHLDCNPVTILHGQIIA